MPDRYWRDAGYRYIVCEHAFDHTVIARFRRRYVDRWQAVFATVLRMCRDAGLIRLGLVVLDGTKVKAHATLEANRSAATIDDQVTCLLAEAAAARQQAKIAARAAEEQASRKPRPWRKPKPAAGRVDPQRVANPTDPDSRIMKTRRGWVQGDNAQLVVTPQQIILASEVTTEAKDVRQLHPMLDQAKAMVERLLGEEARLAAAAADVGFW